MKKLWNKFIKWLTDKPPHGFEELGGGCEGDYPMGLYTDYFLYNQNGFNNSLYYAQGLDLEDPKAGIYNGGKWSEKKYIRHLARDCYPKSYPCFMRIWNYHTFEGGRLFAEFTY